MKQTFNVTEQEVLSLLIKAVGDANPHLHGKNARGALECSAKTDWKLRFTVDVE